ncbi:MAG: formylglycine-generating enzyme family protein [Spirochaetes bacterium]|nr:formylglycine-generating enzyme family protein [Spirochaetota bacterium]
MEKVSWYDALVFANRLSILEGLSPACSIKGKTNPGGWGDADEDVDNIWDTVEIEEGSTGWRLPTEAQWEYAARCLHHEMKDGQTLHFLFICKPGSRKWLRESIDESCVERKTVRARNDRATDLEVNEENAVELCECARARM